ncbi:MAG: hypothetical protein AAGI38_23800, partial [Bacteroidota bacterium]
MLIVLGTLSKSLLAQGYCNPFDPNSYVSTSVVWDWRDNTPQNWEAWIRTKPTNAPVGFTSLNLPFPFRPQNGQLIPNVAHLNVNTAFDHEPSEGWELVFKAFGAPGGLATAVENPTLVLYNRFKGIFRVFIWLTIDQTGIVNSGGVQTRFSRDAASPLASSLFSLMESPCQGVEDFQSDLLSFTPNEFGNSVSGQWFFSDIPVGYDPCTCGYHRPPDGDWTPNISEIQILGEISQNSTFETDDPTGVNEPYPNLNDQPSASVLSFIEKGTKFFKSSNALATSVNKQIINSATMPGSSERTISSFSSVPVKLPIWMKALPYVGDVFLAMDALITGGMKDDKVPTAQTATPTEVTFKGSITTPGDILGHSFYTPGSPYATLPNPDDAKEPIYDHILGIFNLLETPELEYTIYNAKYMFPDDYWCDYIDL